MSAGMEVKSDSGEAEKVPLTANAYEDSIRYQNDSAVFTANGFVADQDRQDGITDILKMDGLQTKRVLPLRLKWREAVSVFNTEKP